jgi:hypothetical protein
MKRDMDKIRDIMLYLEKNLMPGQEIQSTDLPFYDKKDDQDYMVMTEHIKILIENNLIEEFHTKLQGFTIYNITRITTQGHDFLDVLRKDSVWNKTKEKASQVGGFTLATMIEFGKEYIKKEMLKL